MQVSAVSLNGLLHVLPQFSEEILPHALINVLPDKPWFCSWWWWPCWGGIHFLCCTWLIFFFLFGCVTALVLFCFFNEHRITDSAHWADSATCKRLCTQRGGQQLFPRLVCNMESYLEVQKGVSSKSVWTQERRATQWDDLKAWACIQPFCLGNVIV